MRTELIGEIAEAVGVANVIFEAPSKAAQAWFVQQFGPRSISATSRRRK